VRRFLLPLGAFLLLVIVLVVGLKHAPEKEAKFVKSPLLGKPAPQFTLPELVDPAKHFDSAALRGGWHLVNIWATWCVTCREEHEVLLQIKQEGRIPIVGLDWKDEDASAISWLSQLGNPYQTVVADRDGHVAIDFGVYLAPESFLVDPQGIVVEKQYGAMTMEDWRRKFLSHLATPAKAGA
jgi:cytochrome c biogenesis protein CcmG, thiol:disulfide interchange protein DsbE